MASPPRPRRISIAVLVFTALIAAGCASSLPPTTYVPSPTDGVRTMRRGGTAYAAIDGPTGGIVLALESVEGQTALLRLRLHLQNRRDRAFVLDPERDVYLERRAAGTRSRTRIESEPPERALRFVKKEDGSRAARPLRKTTVMPGESVRGAVYFRSAGIAPKKAVYGYEITVHVRTPGGTKRVLLRPTPSPS
jgi:hypothetical protein